MSKKKYSLINEEQLQILREVHEQIIEEGLARSGLARVDTPRFMESAKKTFNTLIDQTQEIIQDKIDDDEIKREIREDTDE